MIRKEKGVTLIALVVTVIVLLILAGVSITAAIGDHDKAIITKARESAEQTEIAAQGEDEVVKEILNKIEDTSTASDKFTVTFVDGNNNVLATVTEVIGTTISYPSSAGTPTKLATVGAKYTFANKWATDPEGTNIVSVSSITSSDRLYAVFNEELIYYTVTFSYKNGSGNDTTTSVSVVGGQGVDDSTVPLVEYTANNYTYTFSKWVESDGSTVANLDSITSNKTVKAVYTSEYVCFVAGTKVLTENGLVDIEDIQVGMKVYSKNEATGEVELKEVKGTFINYVDYDMTKVTVNGEVIESTDGHDYYEVTKGWIDACKLEVGDRVLNSNNEEVVVENVETIEHTGNELTTVYNFEVADNHNYYVGESSILVHNAPSVASPEAGDSCSSSEKESPTAESIS